MKELISKAWALPIPGKAMIGMILAGGVFGILYAAGQPQLAYFAGVAMVVLTFVLAAVALLMKKLDKGKAKAVEEKVAENAATTGGVSKVADRAKLDDLRRQFETGIQTFKDYGKDLYSMPWYALVGEPGSGKTEAIRHSGIGFPPGLQDQLQGTGGTVNMNWWFTDHAVILDTAGRLMFEEVAPGDTNEWREFLKLLRTVRPTCPINGMLLVVPADTLITDTPDEIEKKAGKIAQQFDQIQRSLGVRFPVFVLITKADLINGFREFFDDITDPVLTAQMLGWSNPEGLDEPFRPDRVEEHLETVRKRLLQRRFALLQDPIHTEDSRGRRIDQVDALYKFPEALTEIGPRLKRYLEMIFVAGEWSQKPLFLRGIYFTSSMREGDALDADLANVLGVNVESLPEGKLWERERSYFLRDMFLDKVFKERGLVTRAVNAGQVKRKRNLLLAGSGLAAALVLGAVAFWSWRETDRRITSPTEYWQSVFEWVNPKDGEQMSREDFTTKFSILYRNKLAWGDFIDDNGTRVPIEGSPRSFEKLFDLAKDHYSQNSSSSGLFGLLANLPGVKDAFKAQLPAQESLFEVTLLEPLVSEARTNLSSGDRPEKPLNWSENGDATGALSSLLSLENDRVLGRHTPQPGFDLASTLAFVLDDAAGVAGAAEGEVAGDAGGAPKSLVDYFDWLYAEGSRTSMKGAEWPPEGKWTGGDDADRANTEGIAKFIDYHTDPRGGETKYGLLRAFADAAIDFGEAERALHLGGRFDGVRTVKDFDAATGAWREAYAKLEGAKAQLDAAYEPVKGMLDPRNLNDEKFAKEVETDIWTRADAAYERLDKVFGSDDDLKGDSPEKTKLREWREQLAAAKKNANDNYSGKVSKLFEDLRGAQNKDNVYDNYVAPMAGSDRASFLARFEAYTRANGWLRETPPTADLPGEAIAAINGQEGERDNGLTGLLPDGSQVELSKGARATVLAVSGAVARHERFLALDAAIVKLTADVKSLGQGKTFTLPDVKFTTLASEPCDGAFDPSANEGILAAYNDLRNLIGGKPDDSGGGVLSVDGLRTSLAGFEESLAKHVDQYLTFWSVNVPSKLVPTKPSGLDWRGYLDVVIGGQDRLAAKVREVCELERSAIDKAAGFVAEHPEAKKFKAALDKEDQDEVDRNRRTMLGSWAKLSDSAKKAGDSLLTAATDRENFTRRYFTVCPEVDTAVLGTEERYWSDFAVLGLQAISDETDGAQQIRDARDLARQFPLTLDASGSGLDEAGLERFSTLLQGRDLSPKGGGHDEDPFQHYADAIRTNLTLLRGDAELGQSGLAERLLRAKRVADLLAGLDGKMVYTLASLGGAYDENIPVQSLCFYCKLVAGGNVIRVTYADGTHADFANFHENARMISDYSGKLPLEGELEFGFQDNSYQSTVSTRLTGWQMLHALVNKPAADVAGAGDGTVWRLPLALGDRGVFWIGVRFDKADGLEDLLDGVWLRTADWQR
ncbi:MAG: hypothetical protein H6810_13040 [Phycisphaeraceae bacterium]|nr:MAG: hypothetical protein H6810_13040 [Phycisphaeraceae bacterium]